MSDLRGHKLIRRALRSILTISKTMQTPRGRTATPLEDPNMWLKGANEKKRNAPSGAIMCDQIQ